MMRPTLRMDVIHSDPSQRVVHIAKRSPTNVVLPIWRNAEADVERLVVVEQGRRYASNALARCVTWIDNGRADNVIGVTELTSGLCERSRQIADAVPSDDHRRVACDGPTPRTHEAQP